MRRQAVARERSAFRPGTLANQESHVLLYIAFTIYYAFQDFPVTAGVLRDHAEFLLRTYMSPKSVANAISSVKSFHRRFNFDISAFGEYRLALFMRALPLTVRHVTQRAPPLTLAILRRLCALAHTQGSLGVAFAALLSTAFYSMARLFSLVPAAVDSFDHTRLPTLADVKIGTHCFWLLLKWGKNFQASDQAFTVPLHADLGSPACPVSNLRFLLKLRHGVSAVAPLFAAGVGGKRGGRERQVVFTLTLARTWLSTLLTLLGEGRGGYTFHSFRRGACTLAFEQGAALEDIKSLGGWRSDAVKVYLPLDTARSRAATALSSLAPLASRK